nr:hypothetical protein CFP56_11522 [Quercus suber]
MSSAPPSAAEWQSVRALAHQLYIECDAEKSTFRALAKTIRTLRNKLEEVDEVFDQAAIQPEDVRVLEVAGQGRDVLVKVEQALQQFRAQGEAWAKSSLDIVALQTGLTSVTRKLSHALAAWEDRTGETALPGDKAMRAATPTSGGGWGKKSDSSSSLWSASRSRDSMAPGSESTRTSLSSDFVIMPVPHEEKEVLVVQTAVSPKAGFDSAARSWSAADSWRTPFGSPDPMSFDFETASSLILQGDKGAEQSFGAAPSQWSGVVSPITPAPVVTPAVQAKDNHFPGSYAKSNTRVLDPAENRSKEVDENLAIADSTNLSEQSEPPASFADPNIKTTTKLAIQPLYEREGAQEDTEAKQGSYSEPEHDYEDVKESNGTDSAQAIQSASFQLHQADEKSVDGRQHVSIDVNVPIAKAYTQVANTVGKPELNYPYVRIDSVSATSTGPMGDIQDSSTTEAKAMCASDSITRALTVDMVRTQPDQKSDKQGIPVHEEYDDATMVGFDQHQSAIESLSEDARTDNDDRNNDDDTATLSTSLHDQLRKSLEQVLSRSGLSGATPDLGLEGYKKTHEQEQKDITIPSCPTRAAPPPPRSAEGPPVPAKTNIMRPRAASHQPVSRYRITNPDLPKPDFARRGNQSSEDLYTSSRPSSLYVPEQRTRSKSVEIPRRHEIPQVVVSPPTRHHTLKAAEADLPLSDDSSIRSELHFSIAQLSDRDDVSAISRPLSPATSDKISVSDETEIPPPLPKRPLSNLTRHRPALSNSSARKGLSFDHAGLEVDRRGLHIDDKEFVPTRRPSAKKPTLGNETVQKPQWEKQPRKRGSFGVALPTPQGLQIDSKWKPPAGAAGLDFYAVDVEAEAEKKLDAKRVHSIIHHWNEHRWDEAESHLWAHLTRQIRLDDLQMARRMRHLLGIAASMQGQWHKALSLFISVLNKPITRASKLDAGDCAAAYWLGDTYAMLNRRAEAILAYAVAERGPLFQDVDHARLYKCIRAEQAECLMGVNRTEYAAHWDAARQTRDPLADDSILNSEYITRDAAVFFLQTEPWQPDDSNYRRYSLDCNNSRAQAFFYLGGVFWQEQHRFQIGRHAFTSAAAWPLVFDPYFAIANVSRGRLLAYECDLLEVFSPASTAKVPRTGPVGIGRMECFTCQNLQWLIVTLRECLGMLEIEWSEVANPDGTWFVARYSFMQDRIATTHYFSITLFRQSLRSGYGVEICSGGLCSARIKRSDPDFDRGVHAEEAKRIRKLVREYLDAALKRSKSQHDPPPPTPSPSLLSSFALNKHKRVSSSAVAALVSPPMVPDARTRPRSFRAAV